MTYIINGTIKPIATEAEMLEFGAQIAKATRGSGAYIYLQGSLGVGKTTFTRGFLRAMGYTGKVKSPTYSLIESYRINNRAIHHFDFYRLHDTRELEFIGIHEYFAGDAITLIEWPENGLSLLPDADLSLHFSFAPEGRKVRIETFTERGENILRNL